jgi:6-phosphofructokinase 1
LLSEPEDERLQYGGLVPSGLGPAARLELDEIQDPVTGRTLPRLVDINSEYYEVAREYMIRLEPSDLQDHEKLAKLAAAAMMTTDEFERHSPTPPASAIEAQRSMRAAA